MRIRLIALVTFAAFLTGCYGMSRNNGGAAAQEPTALRVDNRGFPDMTIYALRGGQRVRLGTASGNANSTFTIPSSLLSGITTLRFIADPIGSSRASVSEEITVTPGDSVILMIPPL
jgi:hypothetical protein